LSHIHIHTYTNIDFLTSNTHHKAYRCPRELHNSKQTLTT
jgi:hypothetical protein